MRAAAVGRAHRPNIKTVMFHDGSSVVANLARRGSWQALGSLAAIGLAPLMVFGWARLLMATFRDAFSIPPPPPPPRGGGGGGGGSLYG